MKLNKNLTNDRSNEHGVFIYGYHTPNGYRTIVDATCSECGESFTIAVHETGYCEFWTVNGYCEDYTLDEWSEPYCDDCFSDKFTYCDHCGAVIERYDALEVGYYGDYHYCDDSCAESDGWRQCEECGAWEREPDGIEIGPHFYCCENCANGAGFFQCCECGAWEPEHRFNFERTLCVDCAVDDDGVMDYHAVNHYTTTGTGGEIEVDGGDDPERVVELVREYLGDDAHCEHDGSLSEYGVEIVTAPMGREKFLSFDWEGLFSDLVQAGYRSHDAGTCGFHLHFDRAFFKLGEDATARLTDCINHHWDSFIALARRTEAQAERWASKTEGKGAKAVKDAQKKDCSRYRAVNLKSRFNTVEIRLGRGTLNYQSFRAWYDICYCMAKNAHAISDENYRLRDWLAGVEESTKDYITRRGVSVNW